MGSPLRELDQGVPEAKLGQPKGLQDRSFECTQGAENRVYKTRY